MQTLNRLIRQSVYHCRTNAAVTMVACIVAIELFLHPYLSQHFFSHEVDRALQYLETAHRDQAVVTVGDSVGNGIFGGWGFKNGSVANLACNQATETAGQYFFLKRFLKKNKVPGAVVSCDRTPFSGNLDQNLTENYVQRCFTDWSEILELTMVKLDPVFTVKMIAYKFLATFKYRLHLQEKIAGFTNSDIYTGASGSDSAAGSDYGLIRLLSKFKERQRSESISTYFFKKMLVDLTKIDVPLYYLPPPSRSNNSATHQLIQDTMARTKELQQEYSNVHVINDQYRRLPGKYFHDKVHLNEDGLKVYRPPLQPVLEQIISDSVQRQQAAFSHTFAMGQPVFAMKSFGPNSQLHPLNDTELEAVDGKLIVRSVGNDPALLFPAVANLDKRRDDRVVMRIVLESDRKSTAQVYYSLGMNGHFEEKNSVRKAMKAGRNTLFFILPAEFNGGKLRFDPGTRKGLFTLEQLEAKVVDAQLLYAK